MTLVLACLSANDKVVYVYAIVRASWRLDWADLDAVGPYWHLAAASYAGSRIAHTQPERHHCSKNTPTCVAAGYDLITRFSSVPTPTRHTFTRIVDERPSYTIHLLGYANLNASGQTLSRRAGGMAEDGKVAGRMGHSTP